MAAFFNEEERRGVKRTRFFALDYHIGRGDKYLRFFFMVDCVCLFENQ